MSTHHLRRLELLAASTIGYASLWWLGIAGTGLVCGVTIAGVTIGRSSLAVSILPIQWAIFLQGAINAAFFCALMWQIKSLLSQAHSERYLLRCLGTRLRRIGWLVLIWPLVTLVVTDIDHIISQWGQETFSWEVSHTFTSISFMFIGVVLLIVGSAVERLRRVYDEMQLVV